MLDIWPLQNWVNCRENHPAISTCEGGNTKWKQTMFLAWNFSGILQAFPIVKEELRCARRVTFLLELGYCPHSTLDQLCPSDKPMENTSLESLAELSLLWQPSECRLCTHTASLMLMCYSSSSWTCCRASFSLCPLQSPMAAAQCWPGCSCPAPPGLSGSTDSPGIAAPLLEQEQAGWLWLCWALCCWQPCSGKEGDIQFQCRGDKEHY